MPGQEDDQGLEIRALNLPEDLEPIAVGQLVVEQDEVNAFTTALQGLRGGFGFQYLIALRLKPTCLCCSGPCYSSSAAHCGSCVPFSRLAQLWR